MVKINSFYKMKNDKLNRFVPYIAAVILFLVISFLYFPDVLQGKKLNQHDKKTWKGMSKELYDYKDKTGEHTLWTNSMFGGMPTYLISNRSTNNISKHIYNIIDFGHKKRPATFIFLYLLGFFVALLLMGVKPWLSMVGALAFAFSSYFFIIIDAGHITKVGAIAFMSPIIAGVYHSYKKNAIIGSVVMMIFLALQLLVNHLQITYYTLLIVLIFLIFQLVETIKEKKYKSFIKSSAFLMIAALIALSSNLSQILTTYDYGKDSIRGKSELSANKENKTSGLDKDYATAWSYGKLETFNLLIPNTMGGASYSELSEDSEMYKQFKELGVRDIKKIMKTMPTYWGDQSQTSGPVYIGAIVFFLFVMGLFLVKGKLKWWLLTATILSLLLAWGKNLMFFTEFFLEYFPGYNKFRTVSMILVIVEFTMPFLGILAIKNIVDKKVKKEEVFKALKWSLGIIGGIIIILLINPGILSFSSENDQTIFMRMFGLKEGPEAKSILNKIIPAIESDRASLFRLDAFRSLAFILVGATTIWLLVTEKFKSTTIYVILGIAILADLWVVNKRYLNSDDFVAARHEKKPYTATKEDEFILRDNELNFRVLDLTTSPFQDAQTSYFHKSIGGYHGAKMRRYQELIENVLINEMNYIISILQSETDVNKIQNATMKLSALNMLNTKYIKLGSALPMMNQFQLGNAWFVHDIKDVKNADEEIKAVQNFNPERTAIIDVRFKDNFFSFTKDPDTVCSIILTEYKPNKLIYESKTITDQLAIFSEIYYDKGWNAYVDGKLVPHFRANYVLRAMKVPAGEHKIEFKFEPKIVKTGNTISLVGSVLFILVVLGSIYISVIKKPNVVEES